MVDQGPAAIEAVDLDSVQLRWSSRVLRAIDQSCTINLQTIPAISTVALGAVICKLPPMVHASKAACLSRPQTKKTRTSVTLVAANVDE